LSQDVQTAYTVSVPEPGLAPTWTALPLHAVGGAVPTGFDAYIATSPLVTTLIDAPPPSRTFPAGQMAVADVVAPMDEFGVEVLDEITCVADTLPGGPVAP
jgi:hypothetical protein